MGRLRQRDLKPYTVKRPITLKDTDGTTYTDWVPNGHIIKANIKPAGGKLMAEMYGERLAYFLSAYAELGTDIKESDGVCVFVNPDKEPDYRVVAVRLWSHMVLDLEKVKP